MSDKRPAKNLTVNFINTQYACFDNNVPGVTKETVAAQIEYGHYYLYEGEADAEALKLAEKDPDFKPEEYIDFLVEVGAVREGEAPVFGGGVTINSEDKALKIAKDPANAEQIAKIMELTNKLVEIRKELSVHVASNISISIALVERKKKVDKE